VIRLAVVLGALLELALARVLPETGAGLLGRLAAATVVVLLPGGLIAEALGRRSGSSTVVWSLVAISAALAVPFAFGLPLASAWVVLVAVSVAALVLARRHKRPPRIGGSALVLAAGALFGIALWHVAGHVDGDGLFHLARVRKLTAFDDLSLGALDEFGNGGFHPGYAYPLWHGFLALVAQLAGVDPESVVLHEASVLAPLAFLVVYEAGTTLFRSAWLGGGVLAANVGLISLAAGHGGAYVSLALPATASRQLLVPAVLTLLFAYVRDPAGALLAGLAAGGLVLTLVHPTYSLFLAVPIAGFGLARLPVDRGDAKRIAGALAAFLVPTGAVLLALLPIVRDTASHRPVASELERALALYRGQLDIVSDGLYRVAPELFSRGGAIAVGALALVPLAGFAASRRWAAWVLGGSLAVFALTLVAHLFTPLSELVSLSQSRRLAGFIPFAFALAGGAAVLARFLRLAVLPLALAAGVGLQAAYPGDFTLRLVDGGGPALVAWFAALAGALALALGLSLGRRAALERRGALAAGAVLLFVLPVANHASANWSPSERRRPSPLTPGLVEALRERVPERARIFSDLETSYRIAASAPVYVSAAPPGHVADTERNRPYERRDRVRRFFATGSVSIPRSFGADWLVIDRSRFDVDLALPVLYRDGRYTLVRLSP